MNLEHLKQWQKEKGDYTYRLNYNLNKDSIVFDVGGYEGWFAEQIYNKYECSVYIFEPIKEFYDKIVTRFKGNKKIIVLNYGLSFMSGHATFFKNADSTSLFRNHKNKGTKVKVKLVNIVEALDQLKIKNIDLIKINIEGEEFPLIKKMLDSKIINKFTDIQIQFHQWIEDSTNKRIAIQKELEKTHKQTYNFEFVWENWEIL